MIWSPNKCDDMTRHARGIQRSHEVENGRLQPPILGWGENVRDGAHPGYDYCALPQQRMRSEMQALELIKITVEGLAVRSGLLRAMGRINRHRGLVLAYHNVLPEGETPVGDLSLHMPVRRFEEHLDALTRTCEIVPLTELIGSPGRQSGRPRIAITFDDAYAGTLEAGLPTLRSAALPATIFVAPGLLGGREFWWDRVLGDDRDGKRRRHALWALGGEDHLILEWARAEGLPTPNLPPVFRSATQEALAAAGSSNLVTLGLHSWTHPNLATLAPDRVAQEIDAGIAWLRTLQPDTPPMFAYPYGLRSPSIEHHVQDAGYRFAFRVEGGWLLRKNESPFALPRYNVPAGLSANGLQLRLAGWFCQ